MELKKIDSFDYINELNSNITVEDYREFEYFRKYIINDETIQFKSNLIDLYNDKDNELYVITHNNKLLALGGCDKNGCVFFLTTNENGNLRFSEKKIFISLIKTHRDYCLEKHEYIWNFVFSENNNHIHLLKSIGAEIHNDNTFQYFHLFTIRK